MSRLNLLNSFGKKNKVRERSLRLESLEDRMLLAVSAGSEEVACQVELTAPADTGTEIVVTDLTQKALVAAINSASAGDTIKLSGEGTITVKVPVTISKNITIDGGGTVTIDATGRQMFKLNSSCTFKGLGLTGGLCSDVRTAIGGGLGTVANGTTVNVIDCSIFGNTGAISENSQTRGAGFYVYGTLNMENCKCYSNSADCGGVIYVDGQYNKGVASFNAVNTQFYANNANTNADVSYGAAIANAGGTVTLTNCTVIGNNSQRGAIASYNFFLCDENSGSTADPGNPGNYNHKYTVSDIKMVNTIVGYNYSPDSTAADVYNLYSFAMWGSGAVAYPVLGKEDMYTKISSDNCLIGQIGDFFVEAPKFGEGGVLLNLTTLDATIKSDSIAAYTGVGANPGTYTGEGYDDTSLIVTTLEDVCDNNDGKVSIREALAYAAAGNFDGTPTVTFDASLADGTIKLTDGAIVVASNVNITGDNITLDADGKDRIIYMRSYNYQVDLGVEGNYRNYSSVPECPQHNFAEEYIVRSEITGINFTNGAAEALAAGSGGGAIFLSQNASLTMNNCSVTDSTLYVRNKYNSASCGGGAIGVLYYSDLALNNTEITNNQVFAQLSGNLSDSVIQGGGIYVYKSSVINAVDSVISNNRLTGQQYVDNKEYVAAYGFGAGICCTGNFASFVNTDISYNSIKGVFLNAKGGGVYNTVSLNPETLAHSLVLDNCTVSYNSLGDHEVFNNGYCQGAGIYNAGLMRVVNCLVVCNEIDAGHYTDTGAAMYVYVNGAGIFNTVTRDSHNNVASAGTADIYYSTIADNTITCVDYENYTGEVKKRGAGICQDAYGSHLNLIGSILMNNYVINQKTAVKTLNDLYFNSDGSYIAFSNCLYAMAGISGSGISYDNCVRWSSKYKLFTDEAAGDFTLASDACVIDKITSEKIKVYNYKLESGAHGMQVISSKHDLVEIDTPSFSDYDLRGEPYVRIYGDYQDIGAYEYQPTPSPTPELEITITGWSGVYDGAAHTVALTGTEAGDTITYSLDGETYSSDVISFTNAGTNTIYVKVAREGYKEWSGSAAVAISAKALTISGTTVANKTYDGTTTATVNLGTVSGIVAGDDVAVNASAAFPSAEVGTYDVTVSYTLSGAAAANYTAPAADTVSATISQGGGEQLAAPVISTGKPGVYVSYGANRHCIQWGAVANASGYELAYNVEGTWKTMKVTDTSAVVTGLSYEADVQYKVRALGSGSYTDSEYSAVKTFTVCPMDINNDGDIAGADRTLLGNSWLAEEGDENYLPCCDIDGNEEVSGTDRSFLVKNWLCEVGEDELSYPRPLNADSFFEEFASEDIAADLNIF